jgi:hypothetical protein
MAGPGIAITIKGNAVGVERMLFALETSLNPVAVAGFLGAVVDPYLRGRASDRFASEGDDVTGGWAPLKDATQEIRSNSGYGAAHPINKRTGELEDYIVNAPHNLSAAPWGASLTLPGTTPTGELFDKVETAQHGRDRTVPRPVLGMNERDLVFVLTALAQYIEKRGSGVI